MRIVQVIGRVTTSLHDPSFKGARWLLCSPVEAADLDSACVRRPALSPQPSLIAYDSLGAGDGDMVGVVEGGEATAPFDHDIPIDAITVAIFDSLHYRPPV
jgi:ethanolamine utilization protein EutN